MFSGEKLRVTICGAGRTGHLAAILFSQNPAVAVTLYTSRPETVTAYQGSGAQLHAIMPDGNVIKAPAVRMTASADEACSAADLIIITAPSHVRESVLHSIAPALPRHKQVFVGAIPGFGGFDWMAEKAFGGLSNIVIWGMKDVPILRLILYLEKVSGWGRNHSCTWLFIAGKHLRIPIFCLIT